MCKRKETYGSGICKVETHNTIFKADRQSSCLRFKILLCGRTQWGAFGEIKIDNNNFQKKVKIGIKAKKDHAFDLGNDSIIVECKSKIWTESGNAPSAKIKN